MSCSCNSKLYEKNLYEIDSENPVFLSFKRNLKSFSKSVSEFKQTTDGKSIPGKYWNDVEDLIKKSKLSIAMIELGIEIEDTDDESELKITPMGDTRDGDEQFDKEEEEAEKEEEEEKKKRKKQKKKKITPMILNQVLKNHQIQSRNKDCLEWFMPIIMENLRREMLMLTYMIK